MRDASEGKADISEPGMMDESRDVPSILWGFEGCGSMWTFYSSKELAEASAQENEALEFQTEEAFELDNARREELGYPRISFDQFLDCIRLPATCPPGNGEC
jgi:hypothetical protein